MNEQPLPIPQNRLLRWGPMVAFFIGGAALLSPPDELFLGHQSIASMSWQKLLALTALTVGALGTWWLVGRFVRLFVYWLRTSRIRALFPFVFVPGNVFVAVNFSQILALQVVPSEWFLKLHPMTPPVGGSVASLVLMLAATLYFKRLRRSPTDDWFGNSEALLGAWDRATDALYRRPDRWHKFVRPLRHERVSPAPRQPPDQRRDS